VRPALGTYSAPQTLQLEGRGAASLLAVGLQQLRSAPRTKDAFLATPLTQ